MAVTSTYSLKTLDHRISIPEEDFTFRPDILGLDNRGYVISVETDSDIASYFRGADHVINGGTFLYGGGVDLEAVQLRNDSVVRVFDIDGNIKVYIHPPATASTNFTLTSGSNAAVATSTNVDGFVVAFQRNFPRGDGIIDNDIVVYAYDEDGNFLNSFVVDSTSANDRNASVAVLGDGRIVVAWDRTNADGTSDVHVAVYEPGGDTPSYSQVFSGNVINRNPVVTALDTVGFALSMETGADASDLNIETIVFDRNNVENPGDFGSALPGNHSDPDAALLGDRFSSGPDVYAVAYTVDILNNGELFDRNTYLSLVDTTTGEVLTDPLHPLAIDITEDETGVGSPGTELEFAL